MRTTHSAFYRTKRWRATRAAALRRDGYQCQRCKQYGRTVDADMVHHIVAVEDAPELAYRLENLTCLCWECHNIEHPEKGGDHGGRSGERGRRAPK